MILSGIEISQKKQQQIAEQVKKLNQTYEIIPKLIVILVGEIPASEIYVKNKKIACEKAGMNCEIIRFPETVDQKTLETCIESLNQAPNVNGILVQLPLPQQINIPQIMEIINPIKDVDGFHPFNLGALAIGKPQLRACTPKGIIELLDAYDIKISGMDVLVIGISKIVGLPLILELLNRTATVVCAHKLTKNLSEKIKNADIIVIATGQRDVIQVEDLNPNQIIIDVGIHYIDGKIFGDVYSKELVSKVRAITPVPGGVGPMTICALLENVLEATLKQI
jgi:methylenetetrahydrofolate dehydrogenase (NADP+)/methenyltetrahydrofolate cyclohydrolase